MRVALKGMKGSQKYVAGSQMFQEQHFSWVSATAEDEKESEGVKKKIVLMVSAAKMTFRCEILCQDV